MGYMDLINEAMGETFRALQEITKAEKLTPSEEIDFFHDAKMAFSNYSSSRIMRLKIQQEKVTKHARL